MGETEITLCGGVPFNHGEPLQTFLRIENRRRSFTAALRTIRKIEKNMKRLLFLASLVAATLLAGCSGKGCPGPERNLVVSGGGAADLRLGMTSRYTVFGSGDYEAVSSDPSVATVAVDGRTLSVTGHAVGRATVTLTDLPSDERVEIAVTVVDFYLCLFVSAGTDDDRTVLRRNDGLFLWANDVCEYRLVRNTAHEWWGQFLEYDELQRGTYALSDDGTTLVLTSADGIGDTAFAVEAGTLPPKRFAAIMTEGASALPEEDTPLYLQLTERTSGESFYCRLAPELFYQESASDR